MTRLNPYLAFRGNARAAMEFYKSVFGGKLDMRTYKDFQASHDPSDDNKIMHSVLEAENGVVFMGADAPNDMEHHPGASISMSLSGDDDAELTACFKKLSAGGKIQEPLEKAPWGDKFGMFTDKFGIYWMVNITATKA